MSTPTSLSIVDATPSVRTVAITGASGFIRGALTEYLAARGYAVRLLMRKSGTPPSLAGRPCTVIAGDLHQPDALRALCRGADVVVHCAAHMTRKEHAKSRRVNLEGTQNMLEASARAGVRRFVFIGSIAVDRASQSPTRTFTEAQAPSLEPRLDICSKTHIEGEHMVQAFCEGTPMDCAIVRPTHLHGPGCRLWGTEVEKLVRFVIRRAIDGIHRIRGEVPTTACNVRSVHPNAVARAALAFQPRRYIVGEEAPLERVAPAGVPEMSITVSAPREDAGRWVHAVGSGTSKSDCFKTSGRALELAHFRHLERVGERRVRVGAGVLLVDLLGFLRRERLALPTLGEWGGQTVAGAISTGTHGGAYRHGSLCSSVREVTLVDGLGVERTYREGDPELAHLLPSFGLLGVLTGFELECEPAFSLTVKRRARPLEAYLVELEQNREQAEFRAAIWLPALDCVVDYAARRVDEGAAAGGAHAGPREDRFNTRAKDIDRASRALRRKAWGAPRPGSMRSPERLFPDRTFQGPYDEMLAPIRGDAAQILARRKRNRIPPEAEYALPMPRALELVRTLDAHMQRTGHFPDLPIGLRPGAAEAGTLSATRGALSAWVGLFVYPENPLMQALPDMLAQLGARPHWGKCLFGAPEQLHALYPGWDDFGRLRAALDPEGRFLNAFSARLGIGHTAPRAEGVVGRS